MEVKKSPKADLNNRRLLYVEIGLVVSLGVMLAGFEWTSKEKQEATLVADTVEIIEEEIIPITQQETTPPPPEVPKIPVLSDQIEIVDDDIQIEDSFINLEYDANVGVEIMDYVEEVEEEVVEEEAIPFQLVEVRPTFSLEYPEIAKENGVSGRVMLEFTVMPDGSIANVRVLRGVDPSLDAEAVRVVSSSPKWEPGRQRDRAVKVTYTFPVIFQLR